MGILVNVQWGVGICVSVHESEGSSVTVNEVWKNCETILQCVCDLKTFALDRRIGLRLVLCRNGHRIFGKTITQPKWRI